MATLTAFGPQGQNAALALPAGSGTNRYGSGIDTWIQDCATGGTGTILNAAFFNMLLGNLRQLVKDANTSGAGIAMTDGDMSLVSQAVQYFANLSSYTTGPGLQLSGNQITIDVTTLKAMIA